MLYYYYKYRINYNTYRTKRSHSKSTRVIWIKLHHRARRCHFTRPCTRSCTSLRNAIVKDKLNHSLRARRKTNEEWRTTRLANHVSQYCISCCILLVFSLSLSLSLSSFRLSSLSFLYTVPLAPASWLESEDGTYKVRDYRTYLPITTWLSAIVGIAWEHQQRIIAVVIIIGIIFKFLLQVFSYYIMLISATWPF